MGFQFQFRGHSRVCVSLATVLCLTILLFCFSLSSPHDLTALPFFGYGQHVSAMGIANSTLGFAALLAINTPWRTDRRDALTLAAAQSSLKFEYVAGVNASAMNEKAFPQGLWRKLGKGNVGSWRAHMDAVRLVIERNLTTALIVEDDVDWDVRVREQLASFAVASQRLPGMIGQAREQVSASEDAMSKEEALEPSEWVKRVTLPLPSGFRSMRGAEDDPYGRDWDILWLGHCGTSLPPPSSLTPSFLRLPDDPTVPPPSSLHRTSTSPLDALASLYPPHTRIYHRSSSTLCTLAYAVTQRGARKILYEHGVRNFDKGYDFALSEWCDGATRGMGARPLCLTSSPPVMSQWWPENGEAGGGRSDIMGIGAGGVERGSAYLVRSARGAVEENIEGR